MTRAEYEIVVLRTADADGKLSPPPLADWFQQSSVLIGMYFRGEIEQRGPELRAYDRSGPYYITDTGRQRVAAQEVR